MHCLCYALQDKTIFVTGDAYGTLKVSKDWIYGRVFASQISLYRIFMFRDAVLQWEKRTEAG